MSRPVTAWLVLVLWVATATAAQTPPSPRTLARVGTRTHRIGGQPVRETGGKFESFYASPNERGDIFGPAIHGKAASGVVISVGTLRSVQDAVDATQGLRRIPRDFATYQLDLDPRIVRFNLVSRALLARPATTVKEYARDLETSQASRKDHQSGKVTPPATPSPIGKLLSEVEPDRPYSGIRLGPYVNVSGHDHVPLGPNFVTAPGQFARARALARRGALRPIQGSVTSSTLRELGDGVRAKGQRVSVLDLSNLMDYTGADPGLAANLRAMPWSDDAVVLLTVEAGGMTRQPRLGHATGGWHFVAVPAHELLRAIDRGWFKDRKTLRDLHTALIEDAQRTGPGPLSIAQPGFVARAGRPTAFH